MVKILTIPYTGGWVAWKRPKTPLRNIKMAPNKKLFLLQKSKQFQGQTWVHNLTKHINNQTNCHITLEKLKKIWICLVFIYLYIKNYGSNLQKSKVSMYIHVNLDLTKQW